MAKEWDSWQRFDAVKILTNEQIDKLPEDAEVMGTREQSAGLLFPVFLERKELSHEWWFLVFVSVDSVDPRVSL